MNLPRPRLALLAVTLVLIALCHAPHAAELVPSGTTADPKAPEIAEASDEAQQALATFQVPEPLKASIAAAEPMLANPVAFTFDNQGRLYICETFRQGHGVEDNRNHGHWLDDDLAAQTIEDRQAYIEKHLGEKALEYTQRDDRIRLLTDTNGDGAFDNATIFADHFNELLAGTGAGLLAHQGNVYYTNIPHLWLLRDENDDGQADSRKALHTGYGVRFAFRGHDMHGLVMGPDGKIYFSIGDRGLNVKTEQTQIVNPNNGAVLRCNLDGSDLELVHRGLRNPQELAFDDYGNLFTGDNNSDSGDKARWVYVVEGADSGWRMEYQYLGDRGPWNREKLWHPPHEGQAAYIVPPVQNLGDGPSGLTYYPGTGMGDAMQGRFLMADFRGTPSQSGIRSFRVKPQGAFFELVDSEQYIWQILATDVDFGPDGALYITDWVDGWNGLGKGRVYRFEHEQAAKSALVKEVKQLLASGLKEHEIESLVKLLGHADRRIRMMAQFELVERGEAAQLASVTRNNEQLFARLHALWGLGQLAAGENATADSLAVPLALLSDADPEIRAQAAKLVGAHGDISAQEQLVELLTDDNLRVRYFAAMALGKVGDVTAIAPLFDMLAENGDADPLLRHGGVMGLVGIGNGEALLAAGNHPSASVRLAIAVALRKLQSAEVAKLLDDENPLVVLEAARAIHDLPITEAMPALADMIIRPLDPESADSPLLRRVLNANFRLGTPDHANSLAQFAVRPNTSEAMQLEALAMLGDWASPSPKDRVLNFWRPLAERDQAVAHEAVQRVIPGLVIAGGKVREEGLELAAKLGIEDAAPALRSMASDLSRDAPSRATALTAFAALQAEEAKEVATSYLTDEKPQVRSAARAVLAKIAPGEIADELARVINEGEISERQAALAALADMRHPRADEIIAEALTAISSNKLPPEVTLDVLHAAESQAAEELKRRAAEYYADLPSDDPLAKYLPTLHGGNPASGRQIFYERTQVSCVRCHKIEDRGGEVGPELSKIAQEKDRRYLLEALVLPNAKIAKNFETVVVADEEGKIHTGIIRSENDETLTLITAENKLLTIDQETILARKKGNSAMPEDLVKHLSLQDIRDLVEFLAQRK